MGKMCEDANCKKHHPRDCITMSELKICSDRHCLKNHLKWASWADNLLPRIPNKGGFDGREWRVSTKEMKKFWKKGK